MDSWIARARQLFFTKLEIVARHYSKAETDATQADVTTALALKAPLASPTFTGAANFETLGGAWTGLTFNTGWANFGGGWQDAQWKKVGDIVLLRGLVARTSGVSALIGTLPVGARPLANVLFCTDTDTGAGRLDIYPSGEVTLITGGTSNVNLSGSFFSTL